MDGRRTLEIVGLAGSGKSTLARRLHDQAGWEIADSLHTRLPAHWPYVAHSAPTLLPLLARTIGTSPSLSWDETKFLVYVSEWDRFLRRRPARVITVLDQGPIFALARLLWSGKAITRTRAFRHWFRAMAERWSRELATIVHLVAPDAVLLERINGRAQQHETKGATSARSLGILAAHGRAYDEVLELFAAAGHPCVLRFDTSASTPDSIVTQLVGAVEGVR